MRLTIEEAIALINFVRHAHHEEQLDSIECYGVKMRACHGTWESFYESVILSFTDEKGEEHKVTFSDTTCSFAREALWKMVDVIGI